MYAKMINITVRVRSATVLPHPQRHFCLNTGVVVCLFQSLASITFKSSFFLEEGGGEQEG